MRNIVKNKIFLLICSIIIFIILFVSISYLVRPITKSRQNICGFYAEEEVDVVLIGGSACYCSWQPLTAWDAYGFTSYNFATDAMQPQTPLYAIKEVEKYHKPELFVIDLRPFQYGDLVGEDGINMERVSAFRNFADNLKYTGNRYAFIQNYAPASEEKWTYHFDIAKYHSGLNNLFNLTNWKYMDNKQELLSKGFHYHDSTTAVDIFDTSSVSDEQVLSEEINNMFTELLAYCKDNGHQVLFVVYPYSGADEDQRKYNYMLGKIEEYGFGYLNMHENMKEVGLNNKTDFYDWNHVNILGADKVTAYLGQYLFEHYDLPDNRNNEAYKSWNEDYKIWNDEMEAIRNSMK